MKNRNSTTMKFFSLTPLLRLIPSFRLTRISTKPGPLERKLFRAREVHITLSRITESSYQLAAAFSRTVNKTDVEQVQTFSTKADRIASKRTQAERLLGILTEQIRLLVEERKESTGNAQLDLRLRGCTTHLPLMLIRESLASIKKKRPRTQPRQSLAEAA